MGLVLGRLLLAISLLGTVGSTLRAYPHQLAYFNEAAGGSENGWQHLLGSNLDWGQDWLAVRDIVEVHSASRDGQEDKDIFILAIACKMEWLLPKLDENIKVVGCSESLRTNTQWMLYRRSAQAYCDRDLFRDSVAWALLRYGESELSTRTACVYRLAPDLR